MDAAPDSRTGLLDAAELLFAGRGFRSTTIKAIAAAAGDLAQAEGILPPATIAALKLADALTEHGKPQVAPALMAELLEQERRFAVDEVMPGSALRVRDRLAVRHARRPIGRADVSAACTGRADVMCEMPSSSSACAPSASFAIS